MLKKATLLLLIVILWSGNALAKRSTAAEWNIAVWINSPGITLADLRGKVVIIEFFQLWCPGCNSFSIPLMKHWEQRFAEEIKTGKLVMVSIHTVFEGHEYQNTARLKQFLIDRSITHPVGIDHHLGDNEIPETMKLYRIRGTPEMAIVDARGDIRFQRFGGFKPAPVEQLIDQLIKESTPSTQ
ncbi:MAG: TlpA family protein disulfide reductase [Gammaproteobacteria bacterium]|nr:TlpA family protein disulfide reductase [Gammaproteobacteria bacterium]